MPEQPSASIYKFEAVFTNVRLPIGLTVDSIYLGGENATISQPFNMQLPVPGTVTAIVSAANIAEYLNDRAPGGLKEFSVRLHDGKVYVEATARMIVSVRAKVTCHLDIVDKTQLWIRLQNVDLMGVGAHGLVEKQLEKVNPILDTSSFPIDVQLKTVTPAEGVLRIDGTATMRS